VVCTFRSVNRKRTKGINLKRIYEREKGKLADLIPNDPVSFLHRFSDPRDIELAGFIASQFAYGRVRSVTRFLGDLFGRMVNGPYAFVSEGDFASLEGLYYRFQKSSDIVRLFQVLHAIVDKYGGIGRLIEHHYEGEFRQALWTARKDVIRGAEDLLFFFPKAAPSSPLKRWNLYARWMVRKDEIDFGLWGFIEPSQLIVPLDANVFKIGRCQGWTGQKTQSWKAAREITDVLKSFSPDDPLRYDFLLCHVIGIGGQCTGLRSRRCPERCFFDEV
jgi:uncharacterized protein (TIGR02757 family)